MVADSERVRASLAHLPASHASHCVDRSHALETPKRCSHQPHAQSLTSSGGWFPAPPNTASLGCAHRRSVREFPGTSQVRLILPKLRPDGLPRHGTARSGRTCTRPGAGAAVTCRRAPQRTGPAVARAADGPGWSSGPVPAGPEVPPKDYCSCARKHFGLRPCAGRRGSVRLGGRGLRLSGTVIE